MDRHRLRAGLVITAIALAAVIFCKEPAPIVNEITASADSSTATPAPTSGGGLKIITPSPIPTATPTPTPTATPTPTLAPGVSATPTPLPVLKYITAYYAGGSTIVGHKLDEDQLKVYAYYADGTDERITKGYTLSSDTVSTTGNNRFTVVYRGMTDTFYVQGKVLDTLGVATKTWTFGIGNAPGPNDLTVTANYSDGTHDTITEGYVVSPTAITKEGYQEMTIYYMGKSATTNVYGTKWNKILTLNVYTSQTNLIEGQEVSRGAITVTAVYDTGASEIINTYQVLTPSFSKSGENTLIVSHMGVEAKTTIKVNPKAVKSIRGEYTGIPVMVGSEYYYPDFHVYLQFNDGSEEETTNFKVYNKKIKYVGENVFKVYYGDYKTTVTIEGILEGTKSFNYVSSYTVNDGNYEVSLSAAIPQYLETDSVTGKPVKPSKVKKAYKKLGNQGEYTAFTFGFLDDNDEFELPIDVRITIPEQFEIQYTKLYYTPNRKTIVGLMNQKIVDAHTLEVTVFKVGTYILLYDPTEEEEEADEESVDDDYWG